MGQDWIEFRGHYYKEKILVRRSHIEAIVEVPFDEKNNIGEYSRVFCKSGCQYQVDAPYKKAIERLIDAETAESDNVPGERFTREEYEVIHELMMKIADLGKEHGVSAGPINRSILNKLTKILEEDK